MSFDAVKTVTVGATGASTISFTNIPQTGKDILLWLSTRSSGGDGITISLNGSTSGFTWRRLYSDGTSVVTSSGTTNSLGAASASSSTTSNTFANVQLYIPNYTSSQNKYISSDQAGENNGTTSFLQIRATSWANTSAITSITLTSEATFVENSMVSLYTIS